jgi:hypothetical protein
MTEIKFAEVTQLDLGVLNKVVDSFLDGKKAVFTTRELNCAIATQTKKLVVYINEKSGYLKPALIIWFILKMIDEMSTDVEHPKFLLTSHEHAEYYVAQLNDEVYETAATVFKTNRHKL